MKIGELAQQLGISTSTVRMYEQRGLLDAGRSPGGTRHYGEEELERVRAITALTRADIAIEDLARLTRVRLEAATGNAAGRQVEAILAALEDHLSAQIAVLQATLDDVRRAQGRLPGCHGCRRRPTRDNCAGCPVADELLACSVMKVVWDQAQPES